MVSQTASIVPVYGSFQGWHGQPSPLIFSDFLAISIRWVDGDGGRNQIPAPAWSRRGQSRSSAARKAAAPQTQAVFCAVVAGRRTDCVGLRLPGPAFLRSVQRTRHERDPY